MDRATDINKGQSSRLPVSLTAEDNALVIALQAILQARQQKRLSISSIVRLALRNLAEKEGLLKQ